MELLAIALVLIFVLHLIDKHNRWRQALGITIGLILFGIVGAGGIFGWQKYQAYRGEKEQQAITAAWQARVSECVSRLGLIPIPKDAADADVPADIQRACDANPEATTFLYISTSKPLPDDWFAQKGSSPKAKVERSLGWAVVMADFTSIVKRCAFDVGTDPCGYFDTAQGEIAHLNKGDRVQILSDKIRAPDGTEIYEVRFQQWTGWLDAKGLNLEK